MNHGSHHGAELVLDHTGHRDLPRLLRLGPGGLFLGSFPDKIDVAVDNTRLRGGSLEHFL